MHNYIARLQVTGIFRAVAKRPNPRVRSVRSVYRTYVDSIHFRRSNLNESSMSVLGEYANNGTASGAGGGFGNGSDNAGGSNNNSTVKQFSADRIREFRVCILVLQPFF